MRGRGNFTLCTITNNYGSHKLASLPIKINRKCSHEKRLDFCLVLIFALKLDGTKEWPHIEIKHSKTYLNRKLNFKQSKETFYSVTQSWQTTLIDMFGFKLLNNKLL